MLESSVIIGNGLASAECVKAARGAGYRGALYVVSDTSLPAFNPMLATYFASGKIEYKELFPYGDGFDFYDQYGVTRLFGSSVTSLDAENRVVKTAGGQEISYDKCVIAAGAAPMLPGVFQSLKDSVCMLRTADDAVRFKEILGSDRKRALVVGASMIGVKAVEALADAGFAVTLTDFAKSIFPLAAHENCSEIIHRILEEKGIRLVFGALAEKAEKNGNSFSVRFSGSQAEEVFDHIVVCAGAGPNISFVNPGQIKTDKGILVNEYLETSAEGVYAAGDVCRAPGAGGEAQMLGLVSAARLQGRIAGQNLAGRRARYSGTIPHNFTHFFGHDFAGAGDVNNGDEIYEEADRANSRYIRLVFTDRKLTGINLFDIPEISGILKYHLTKGLLAKDALRGFTDESPAMNRLYEKFPGIEKTFSEMR
ncbi:MAG: FAD-dependent oxidoreductase [Clostridiales bacterium]|nr:FAD-dependent oxidoreductase [Clostridiales bacterium]